MNKIYVVMALAFLALSCRQEPVPQTDAKPKEKNVLPEWAKDDVIYEVNLRQFTPEGTINAFSDHIPRLKEMGVDILWLMPVFPISETKRKGTMGSYYAVSDFRSINPEFGTIEDMKNLIDKIHAYKMKVILDWVPNHTGWDHTWIKSHPEFYTKNAKGEITDPLNDEGKSMDWTDVADLDYNNQNMRKAMISDMLYWIEKYQIDGFRMDVAWGVPDDFWETFSDTLYKVKPDAFMLAEAEMKNHMNNGYFHCGYAWTFHHMMNDIAQGKKNVKDVLVWKDSIRSQYQRGSLMHFITNHDENSWKGTEFERMGDGYKTFAVMAMTFDGIPLIYSGQEEPLTKRLKFFEKDAIVFEKLKDFDFFQNLCLLKSQEEAMWSEPYGAQAKIIGYNDHCLAYSREKNKSKVVVILNLSDQARKLKLKEGFKNMLEIFKRDEASFSEGDEINLKPWEYRVYITQQLK